MSEVTDFLEHFGVKGMKWGVRRRSGGRSSARPGAKQGHSKDAKEFAVIQKKAKRGGSPKALTNKELQAFNQRMDLERRYKQLQPPSPAAARAATGKKVVTGILAAGITVNQVMAFANSPAGKVLKNNMDWNTRG